MRKCSQAADGILVSRKTVTNMIDTQVFKALNISMENWLILLNNTTGTFDKEAFQEIPLIIFFMSLGTPSGKCGFKKKAKGKEILPAISGLEESPVW